MDIKSITDQVGGVLGIAGNAKSLVETLLQTFERIRQKNLTQGKNVGHAVILSYFQGR